MLYGWDYMKKVGETEGLRPDEVVKKYGTEATKNSGFSEMYSGYTECVKDQKAKGNDQPYLGCQDCMARGDFSNIIISEKERMDNPALDFIASKNPDEAVHPEIRKIEQRGPSGPRVDQRIGYTARETLKGVPEVVGDIVPDVSLNGGGVMRAFQTSAIVVIALIVGVVYLVFVAGKGIGR